VQALHIPFVLAAQPILTNYLLLSALDKTVIIAVIAVFLGLLAGIFEEPGRFLVFKYFFKRRKIELNKRNALMFGLGWGGIESMFIGIIMFLTMFSYMTAAPLTNEQINDINAGIGGSLTAEQTELMKAQTEALINLTPVGVLPSLFERLMTIVLHVAWTLMVLSSIILGRKSLLLLAIIWHAIVDAAVVFLGQTSGILIAEIALFVFAAIALFYIIRTLKTTRTPKLLVNN